MTPPKAVWPTKPVEDRLARHGVTLRTMAVLNGLDVAYARNLDDRFRSARRRGLMTMQLADTIAIDVLGIHPGLVWPDLWWDESFDPPAEEKLCPCGKPKVPGARKNLCEECYARFRSCACGCGQPRPTYKAKYARGHHRNHGKRFAA